MAANIFSSQSNQAKKKLGLLDIFDTKTSAPSATLKGNTAGNVGTNLANTTNNVFTPIAQKMYDRPAGPTLPKPSQPNAATTYDTNYQNYLKNRTNTANTLAENNAEEEKKKAQEAYDLEKSGLEKQVGNLTTAFNTYKTGKAGDVAAYNDVVARNKENAKEATGTTQRTLAMTRRQQLGENQKTYANLGTIDSYGTGSFQQTNENTETNFLRMTNENYKGLEDKLFTLDQDAASYKRKADMDVAAEESKFNDAVIKINQLLAGNEQMKTQAIRAAEKLLAEKKAEISDEYDRLTLETEKQKADAQKALDAESAKGKQMFAEYQQTSPEFQKTGKITTANDWIFVNKYKDAYDSIMKNGSLAGGKSDTATEMTNVIDKLVSTGGIGGITGWTRTDMIPGSKAALAKNYYNQLKGMLSLENRQKLKGSGAISDYESKVLAQAASALDQNLSEDQFMQVLNDLKTGLKNGSMTAGNGANTGTIRVQKKDTGEFGFIPASEFDPNIYNQA